MSSNSEEENQTNLNNETPARDVLRNYFIERKERMIESSLLFYRVANAILYALLKTYYRYNEGLTQQVIIARIKIIDTTLAEVPNLKSIVSNELLIGCGKFGDTKLYMSYVRNNRRHYIMNVIDISSQLGYARYLMTFRYIKAFNQSKFSIFTDHNNYGLLVKHPSLTEYHTDLLFTLFWDDHTWSEYLCDIYVRYVFEISKPLKHSLNTCVSYLFEIGRRNPLFYKFLHKYICLWLGKFLPPRVSLYQFSNHIDEKHNINIVPLHQISISVSPKDFTFEIVGISMLMALTTYIINHPDEVAVFSKMNFIECLQNMDWTKDIEGLEIVISYRLAADSDGADKYYDIIHRYDGHHYSLDESRYSRISAYELAIMASTFFRASSEKNIHSIVALENLVRLENHPKLAKVYIFYLAKLFPNIEDFTKDIYHSYVKSILLEAELHSGREELYFSHLFTLGEIKPEFFRTLMRYIVPLLERACKVENTLDDTIQ